MKVSVTQTLKKPEGMPFDQASTTNAYRTTTLSLSIDFSDTSNDTPEPARSAMFDMIKQMREISQNPESNVCMDSATPVFFGDTVIFKDEFSVNPENMEQLKALMYHMNRICNEIVGAC